MKVPFGTITITETSQRLIKDALNNKRVSSGKYVRQFEERFADKMGVKEAVAVSSGTDAIILALSVLYEFGAIRGEKIVVPALSFPATGHAVIHAGFEPRFVDIQRDTFNLDLSLVPPVKIAPPWVEDIAGYLPVHLMGKPLDFTSHMHFQNRVIEDCAEAYGSEINGRRRVGTFGLMGCFSTYLAHTISTVEGGVVITNDEAVGEILRSLRSHGRACACKSCLLNSADKFCPKRFEGGSDIRFRFERIGYSSKMNELEAAVGLGNLEIYDEILAVRRINLQFLLSEFGRFSPYLWTFEQGPNEKIGPHAFPFVLRENVPFTRDQLALYLEKNGIETRTMFVSMPTQHSGFAYLGHQLGEFPNAEYISDNGLHIGVHQDLTLEQLEYFLETIEKFLKEVR